MRLHAIACVFPRTLAGEGGRGAESTRRDGQVAAPGMRGLGFNPNYKPCRSAPYVEFLPPVSPQTRMCATNTHMAGHHSRGPSNGMVSWPCGLFAADNPFQMFMLVVMLFVHARKCWVFATAAPFIVATRFPCKSLARHFSCCACASMHHSRASQSVKWHLGMGVFQNSISQSVSLPVSVAT